MKFYILDDHAQVIRIIENIIEEGALGEVIGTSTDAKDAVTQILALNPDILIIDFLMPEMDGPRVVAQIKTLRPECQCIMLSQVSAKNLIEKAYHAGISFFISKPVNQLEVTRVIKQVTEKILMTRKFAALQNLLGHQDTNRSTAMMPEEKSLQKMALIKHTLAKIGIMGEAGAEDILKICQYYVESKLSTTQIKVNDVCLQICDNPKAMEQRLRRAINRGLINLANLGIEDYMNDTFIRFSSTLYDFESIKAEMDYIRGKRTSGGKINARKFIDNLLLLNEN